MSARWSPIAGVLLTAAIVLSAGEPVVRETRAQANQPFTESMLWLAPEDEVVGGDLARGAELLADGRAADALVSFGRALGDPVLGLYARLYVSRAYLALGRFDDAELAARQIVSSAPGGAAGEGALSILAASLEGRNRWNDAAVVWQTLAGVNTAGAPAALLRAAQAGEKGTDPALARLAYARIYYEFPTSAESAEATKALVKPGAPVAGPDVQQQELNRAEKLFAARRYADARKSYEAVAAYLPADQRDAAALRLAQLDFHQQRYVQARDRLRAIRQQAPWTNVDAEYYWLGTLRGLKLASDYIAAVAQFVERFPAHPLTEAALNELATYYILGDNDGRAAEVFTAMYARFPTGAFADRAAWKAGWWAYRNDNYRETIRIFESAAVAMRRADYRPSWLYWAARAHEELGEREAALAGYRQTVAFYRNSYYGRAASRAMTRLQGVRLVSATPAAPLALAPGAPPPNARIITALLRAELYDDAIAELRRIQQDLGSTPLVEATIAYALGRKGELRPGITAMRRAYPQFMAEGGETLPRRILTTIFPVDHWDLIRRYAAERRIDPFLLTALVAQESTFQADVRSSADAWGLMQLLPSTGRRYALKTGIRGFTTARLTDPETNVRLGTAYLSELLEMFGEVAPALASYNAGEHRVKRWLADRPGIPMDEFIDDIPFPETQNYVKRIIGTAEDYRILYSHLASTVPASSAR
jgi:soluble lytic murein transglycosylase